jgi:hypothetical protein
VRLDMLANVALGLFVHCRCAFGDVASRRQVGAAGNRPQDALGFPPSCLYGPGRAVAAYGKPACPTLDSGLEDENPVPTLAAHAEALHVGIPGEFAGLECIDRAFGEPFRRLACWLQRRGFSRLVDCLVHDPPDVRSG